MLAAEAFLIVPTEFSCPLGDGLFIDDNKTGE
jgi:hypothetical protein